MTDLQVLNEFRSRILEIATLEQQLSRLEEHRLSRTQELLYKHFLSEIKHQQAAVDALQERFDQIIAAAPRSIAPILRHYYGMGETDLYVSFATGFGRERVNQLRNEYIKQLT